MVNNNDKRKKLLKYKEIIMRMPSNKSKVLTISGYVSLLYYYKELSNLKEKYLLNYDIDDEFTYKYRKYITKNLYNKLNEMSKLAVYLYKKFDTLINEYKNNYFYSYELYNDHHINIEQMHHLMNEFVLFLGEDVNKLYNKIIHSNNAVKVFDNELDSNGVSMDAFPIDYPFIVVQNYEKYFSYYFTLAHELGHCYQFYLTRNHKRVEVFNPFCEVTSLLFEKLFSAYLSTENNLKKDLFFNEIDNHLYFLNDLSASKVLCELLIKGDIQYVDPQDLSYKCNVPYEELQRRMIMDCGYILPNKMSFELTEFHYAIGEIISNYFFNKMQSDFYGSWKEYKDFICTVNDYPLKEVLDQYMDVDLYKEKINTFVKSYHYR